MDKEQVKDPIYKEQIALRENKGLTTLGMATNVVWHEDPKRLLFMLSRCKFVSKMLSGKKQVLEVGCGDAFSSRIMLQEVGSLCAVDTDPVFVKDVNERMEEGWKFECRTHDILSSPLDFEYDAAYCLDVLEHIPDNKEHQFISNIVDSISKNGILIIGTPSVQSERYASFGSKQGHINLKDHIQLKNVMFKFFNNVFIFSMNDELVHTGFYPMAHYLFAVGVGKK